MVTVLSRRALAITLTDDSAMAAAAAQLAWDRTLGFFAQHLIE